MVAIYQPPSKGGIWYIKVKVDGKWVPRSLGTRSKVKAGQEARHLLIELAKADTNAANSFEAPEPIQSDEVTLTGLLESYTDWATSEAARRDRTVESRAWAVSCWIKYIGVDSLGAITKDHVKAFKEQLQRDKRTAHTVNDALRGLTAIVNRAIREDWWDGVNVFSNIERMKITKRRVRVLGSDEYNALLWAASLHSPRLALWCALGLEAGMRKMELAWAEWDWVDWDNNQIWVQESEWFKPKDYEERAIPISPTLREFLDAFRQPSGFIVEPDVGPGRSQYRIDPKKGFKAVSNAAGVEWLTPHLMRHSFASRLILQGVPIGRVARYLGHSMTRTTEMYWHLLQERG